MRASEEFSCAASEGGDFAVVMLAGGLRPSPLSVETSMSVLDLPIDDECRLFDHWLECLEDAVPESTRLEVVCSKVVPLPAAVAGGRRGKLDVHVSIERDDYRGPAGIVADVCRGLGSPSRILIVEAARWVDGSIGSAVSAGLEADDDVVVYRNRDGSPAGMYLASARALELVPSVGFMDLKEQWLGKVGASGLRTEALTLAGAWSRELRTRGQLLGVIGSDRPELGVVELGTVTVATGRQRSIVCAGAEVEGNAVVSESIVMPGARVGDGACVIRSIVCSGGRVEAGETIVETVVGSEAVTA